MTSGKQRLPAGSGTTLSDIVGRVQQISAENESLVRRLADGETRFRHLAKAVWRVQEEERRSIALELHDGLGQVLTALINHMQHRPAGGHDGPDDEAVELATAALAEVRRLSRALRPSVLDDLGLDAALRWLVRTTTESSDLEVELAYHDEPPALDKETETLVFRIAQEAMTNVVKHANASRARIALGRVGRKLQIVITDNGRGFEPRRQMSANGEGFGARGMCDRAELFGGRLLIDSAPNQGTTVTLELPGADR